MRKCLPLSLSLFCSVAIAQDVSRLYTDEKLKQDAERFGEQIRAEYRETILPKLTEAERRALSTVKINVPVKGAHGDPFEFYYRDDMISLPALSLRFYADLCVANAWLAVHGFDTTTIRNYVALLFREAYESPRAPLPAMFATLGVPHNAREEARVSARADQSFGSMVVFLLGHELGHALKKDSLEGRDAQQQRAQEIEADRFAIELMRRIGQMPFGMEFWFDVERYRVRLPGKGIPSEEQWQQILNKMDHPVTTERLKALADAIEKDPESFARLQDDHALWTARAKTTAQMLRQAAPFADNRIARAAEYDNVRDVRKAHLKPRKAPFAVPGITGPEEDFSGLFRVRRTAQSGNDEIDLLLLRDGDEVRGHYINANVSGSIQGQIKNGVLDFDWSEGNAQGHGKAESRGDTLQGTWGMGKANEGAGEFTGDRQKKESTGR
jgi:hypothetical protein